MATESRGSETVTRPPTSTLEQNRRSLTLTYEPHPDAACDPTRRMSGFHPVRVYHMDRYRYAYRAVQAGTGGGKSFAGTFEDLMWCLENPGNVAATWEPTFPMVNKIFYPTVRKLLGTTNIRASPIVTAWSRSEHRIEFVNDSVLWLGSLEDPTRAEGQNLDRGRIDEARLVKHLGGEDGALMIVDRRLRGSNDGNKTSLDITTSAPTKELYDFFENPATKQPGTQVYRWASADNPRLPKRYKELMASYSSRGGAVYKRFVLGEYARAEGLVYETFDPVVNVKPDPSMGLITHVTVGVDWGWTHPAALEAIAWSGNSVAHVIEEVYGSHLTIADLVRFGSEIQTRYGLKGVKFWCGADRPDHIQAFQDAGLDAEGFQGKVLDGIGVVQDMFSSGELTIGKGCPNLLRELDTYAWKRGAKEQPEDVGEDACLIGDTLVSTPTGRVPIRDINVRDTVMTRGGPRLVAWSGATRRDADVFRVVFSDGTTVTGTGGHPVWVEGNGFTRIDALRYGDTVCNDFSSMGIRTRGTLGEGIIRRLSTTSDTYSTGMFGPKPTAKSQKGSMSTTSTSSPPTTFFVVDVLPAGRMDVYNLTVEGDPEFFANGVLVHNCSALRYGVCGGPPESAEVLRGKHHASARRLRRG